MDQGSSSHDEMDNESDDEGSSSNDVVVNKASDNKMPEDLNKNVQEDDEGQENIEQVASGENVNQPNCCRLCGETDINEKLKLFNETFLNKCLECHDIKIWCKKHIEKCALTIPSNVNLPSTVDNDSYYHSSCYRRFTAINKKYREAYNNRSIQSPAETDEM